MASASQLHITATNVTWSNFLGPLPALKSLRVQLSAAGAMTTPSFDHMAGVTFVELDFKAVPQGSKPSMLHAWVIATHSLPRKPRMHLFNLSAPFLAELVRHGILGRVVTRLDPLEASMKCPFK